MKKIDACVFDADGVVINKKWMFSQVLARDYGLAMDDTNTFFAGPFQDCLIGKKDAKEVLPEYLTKWKWDGSIDEFLHLWFTSEHYIDTELIKEIDVLRAKGYKTYMATNQEKYRTAYMESEMGFGDHFDHIFSSAELGCKKPELAFYNAVSAAIGTSSIYFWDDDEKNVIGAREAGWQASVYRTIDDVKSVFKNT